METKEVLNLFMYDLDEKNITKICTNPNCIYWGNPQPLENFRKSLKSKDKHSWYCKTCLQIKNKQYAIKNREKILKYKQNYRNTPKNQNKIKKSKQLWVEKNREHHNEKNRQWLKNNPGYGRYKCATRRALRKKATLPWVNLTEISNIYEHAKNLEKNDNIKRDIHHIIPLVAKDEFGNHIACGLHVPWNLEIMEKEKHQKLDHTFKIKIMI